MLGRPLPDLRATGTDYNHSMSMLENALDIDSVISDMVEIITRGWDPLQVVLFGSRARGDVHKHSDVDLLVVLDDCDDCSGARDGIRDALRPLQVPTDIVVTTPALLVKRACLVGAVERKALFDGRILYVRGGGDPVTEAALHLLQLGSEDLGSAELLLSSEIANLRDRHVSLRNRLLRRRSKRRWSWNTTTTLASISSTNCSSCCRRVGRCTS